MGFARGDVRDHIVSPKIDHAPFVAALQNVTAEEKSKNQLPRYFWCCPIFDFCNSNGTERTFGYLANALMSANQPDFGLADRSSTCSVDSGTNHFGKLVEFRAGI